jgi:alpha-D-xyloside xylohydrolase
MRALAFDFRTDTSINNISDQYMFGPAILVNPVTQKSPVEETRKVYLPKSSDWFDFWTGKKLSGGFTITTPAPIETIPLFIKAGSIIPMGPYLQYATEKPADPIELRIYPGADGAFTLYEDENDNYNYEKGNHSTIDFKWDEYKRELTIGQRQGKYPGMLNERTINIIIVGKNHGTDIEICQQPDKIVKYYGSKLEIKF